MSHSTHRFKATMQSGDLAGYVFLVVDPNPQDMHLWSEVGTGGGCGMTWRGPLKAFKATFSLCKLAPKS